MREIQGFLLDQFKVEANGNFIGIVTDSVLEVGRCAAGEDSR